MNTIEKIGTKLKLYGFGNINENQIITIKIFDNGDTTSLVITPKGEKPIANRVLVSLSDKEITDPIIVELLSKYLPENTTPFIYSEGIYLQNLPKN